MSTHEATDSEAPPPSEGPTSEVSEVRPENEFRVLLERQQASLEELRTAIARTRSELPEERLSMVVFSGEMDKLLAALVIATGAAASGMQVKLFFTFWGTSTLRKKAKVKKDWWGKMFGFMLPRGPDKTALSRMNWGGAGPLAMKHLMKKQGVADLEELLALCAELGVQIDVCTMSMELLGFSKEEIRPYPHLGYCGVASFIETAAKSRTTLFI